MIIYNVTVGIDNDIEQEWLKWMKEKHIPDVMACGKFFKYNIFKVLNQEQELSTSYSIQYHAREITDVITYLEEYAPPLVEEHKRKFKDKHVAFRTLLEAID